MKIPFTLEAWLKDKSQRVETRDGRIVHNIWPVKGPILVNGKMADICALIDGEEDVLVLFEGGKYLPVNAENPFDLFIVTPEPELSEFEIRLLDWLSDDTSGEISMERMKELAKNRAAELLSLARKELIKEPYYTSDPRETGLYKLGKAEALKDLPRWTDDGSPKGSALIDIGGLYGFDFILRHGKLLRISDLEKLPGFKED